MPPSKKSKPKFHSYHLIFVVVFLIIAASILGEVFGYKLGC